MCVLLRVLDVGFLADGFRVFFLFAKMLGCGDLAHGFNPKSFTLELSSLSCLFKVEALRGVV